MDGAVRTGTSSASRRGDPPDIRVLYEDNHLLALDKPAGLLTQASGLGRENLEDMARTWIRSTRGKPGNVFLHAVHRLDRLSSGIVLFARTSKALTRLNGQMRERSIRKVYLAVVSGGPHEEEGTLEHTLRHSRMKAVCATPEDSGAHPCTLHFRVVARSRGLALVEVELVTGRYHQIRAQMSASGFPVLGDTRYGGKPVQGMKGIALHHARMEFSHPTTALQVIITSPLPEDWPVFPGHPTTHGRRAGGD